MWEDVFFGEKQGQILDLFLAIDDIAFDNFANINTVYCEDLSTVDIILSLQDSAKKDFQCFPRYQMKGSIDICHLNLRKFCETFYIHHKIICEKANTRLMGLTRATPYMNTEKWRIKLNAFLNTQFHYCPQIWILHSRCSNNKIKYLHERFFQHIYNGKYSLYKELFKKDEWISFSLP